MPPRSPQRGSLPPEGALFILGLPGDEKCRSARSGIFIGWWERGGCPETAGAHSCLSGRTVTFVCSEPFISCEIRHEFHPAAHSPW